LGPLALGLLGCADQIGAIADALGVQRWQRNLLLLRVRLFGGLVLGQRRHPGKSWGIRKWLALPLVAALSLLASSAVPASATAPPGHLQLSVSPPGFCR